MSYLDEDISSDASDYSDIDDLSSQSSNESAASSPSVLVFNEDQIQQSIINNPFIQQLIHNNLRNTNINTCNKTQNNILHNGSQQETDHYSQRTLKPSHSIKIEPIDNIDIIKHESTNNTSRFQRRDLELQSLDELLAKAMSYVPSLRWDEDNEWCRYCGARCSQSFLGSPWGKKQLCSIHHRMWKQNQLDLSMYPSPPPHVHAVINRSECTEKQYLIDLLTNIDIQNEGKRRSLRNQIKIKQEKAYNESIISDFDASNDDESDSDSFHSSYSMSSEPNDIDDDDDYGYIDIIKQEPIAYLDINKNNTPYLSQPISTSAILKIEDTSPSITSNNMSALKSENGMKIEQKKSGRDWKKYYKYKRKTSMNPIECNMCNEGFVTHTKYRKHMNNVHGIERPYKCYQCAEGKEVRYSNNAGLIAHIRRDHEMERRFKCALCPKAFYEKSVLEKHQRVHDGKKPFVCMYCNGRFTQKASLRQHVRSIHLKQRNYKCIYCTKTFAALGTMKSHMVRIHDDSKYARFQCDICYKRFYERGHFVKHKETSRCRMEPIDEAIRRGECFYRGCNKKYRSKTRAESVKVHLVRMHKDRRYARYECRECDKLFYDKTGYRKHNQKRHKKIKK